MSHNRWCKDVTNWSRKTKRKKKKTFFNKLVLCLALQKAHTGPAQAFLSLQQNIRYCIRRLQLFHRSSCKAFWIHLPSCSAADKITLERATASCSSSYLSSSEQAVITCKSAHLIAVKCPRCSAGHKKFHAD